MEKLEAADPTRLPSPLFVLLLIANATCKEGSQGQQTPAWVTGGGKNHLELKSDTQ